MEVQEEALPEKKAMPVQPVSQATVTENTDKFRAHFKQIMQAANLPGPDYFEFNSMVSAMSMIPDEKARYIAAYAGLQAQGLSLEKLNSSAGQYLTVLDEDAANFRKTLNQAEIDKVNKLKLEVQSHKDKIAALTEEIRQLDAAIKQMESEVQENESKLHQNAQGYELEYEKMRQEILQQLEKIKSYL